MQMQQDLFRQWGQQWLSLTPNATGSSGELGQNGPEALGRAGGGGPQETAARPLDSIYESSIQFVEQTARASEAKSAQELGQMVEEFWRQSFDTLKGQSETPVP